MKIALASNNPGKVKEFQILFDHKIEFVTMAELGIESPEETGLTFVENAILKARYVAECTHLPTLADDSGLCVPALNGAPGLYSSRYAGEPVDHAKNIERLLSNMSDLSGEARKAYFYCVIVLLQHAQDPTPLIGEGRWDGLILQQRQGEGGFGYDPIYQPTGFECSAAELSTENKNQHSHRYRALQALRKQWV